MKTSTNHEPPVEPKDQPWVDVVRQTIDTMRFGTVQIVVHEGRVMQVDATHRTRIEPNPATPARK